MNIYARYFDQDILVYSVEELIDFLSSIPDIHVTPELINDIHNYVEGDMPYPKRYKIRPRVYFILIKTTANTMEEFKTHRKQVTVTPPLDGEAFNKKEFKLSQLAEERQGWYKGHIAFKRVIQIPGTGKFQYQDTDFVALVKAFSGQDCYNKIVNHLKNRSDIDLGSQFPSARGQNYQFTYIDKDLPKDFVEKNKLKVE